MSLKFTHTGDELELLQQAADTYDWKAIETEVEPKFREAAMDFRDRKHSFLKPWWMGRYLGSLRGL